MQKLLVFGALALFLPNTARSQDLTPAQQEIWDIEVACWEAKTSAEYMPCFHEDFVGWGLGSTVTTTKAQRALAFTYRFETEELVFLQLIPVDIIIHGNMAVVMYVANFTTKNRASGEEQNVTHRWTDIFVNDGDRWAWISDHGVDITAN